MFGENDKNLKRLREKLGAKIIARGDAIKLEGTPEDIRVAESLIRDLLSVVRQGGEFSLDEIDRGAVISSNGGSMFEDTNMENKDLELPKRLRPKTKGQKAYIEAINSSDITFGIGPAGTGKCVSGDTLVLTQCGIVPISSLAQGVAFEEQRRKPTRIFGLDGREWATHVYNGGVQKTIRLQTRHGFSIEGTAEHPLLTLNSNGEPEWIRMDQVKEGTVLALTRDSGFWGDETRVQHEYTRLENDKSSKNIELTEIDSEFAYFMGLIVGDGCTTRRGYILFSSYDEELRTTFKTIASRFGLHVTKHGSSLRLNSTQLSSLLMHLGIGTAKAHLKTMPDCILRAPREINIAFIQGLFDTDGHASKRDGYPSLCSSSHELIQAVQIVLLNLGLVSMVWRKKTTHLDTYILELRGSDAKRFYEIVGFRLLRKQERASQLKAVQNTNIDVIPNLASSINEAVKAQPLTHNIHKWIYDYRIGRRKPSYQKLEQILEVCRAPNHARERLEWLATRQLLWSEVKEISYSSAQVYDLTVPGTHSFTANGFVSHNSYLAVAMAVAAFKAKRVKRIILTRPAVEAGERLGFLPGDLQAKIDPYLRPLYDALFDMIDAERFESYLSSGAIEVAPLAFMRGRTLNDAFIILDEAQNTTPEQMKMFLTRMGFSSKVVVTGDVTQVDLPKSVTSGLEQAKRYLQGIDGINFVYFTESDVVRHPLVGRIIHAYEEHS